MSKKVLFVCMGNICRSPAGEAVMKRFAEEFRSNVIVESAGTHGYHVGEPADGRMRAAAETRGYEIDGVGRKVNASDLRVGRYDLVLAMDSDNHAFLVQMAGGVQPHIRLFSDYLDESWPRDVPDPYYGGDAGFEQVLDILEEGCPIILQTLVGDDALQTDFEDDGIP